MEHDKVNTLVNKNQLIKDLTQIGLKKGDIIYVHSSLKSVGWIDGGAETLIDAFLSVLGKDGTLAVPTHTYNFENRIAEPYDIDCSKSLMGAFSEAVRVHPKAVRSGHASHSSAAIGGKADYLTANHDLSNALGYDSPLNRIYRENGKILLLGVTHKVNTMLHLAESLSNASYVKLHYDETWGRNTLILNSDKTIKSIAQSEFPGCSAFFPLIEGFLRIDHVNTYGKIGNAESQLIESKPMVLKAINIIQQYPSYFLCNDEKCPCCPPRKNR